MIFTPNGEKKRHGKLIISHGIKLEGRKLEKGRNLLIYLHFKKCEVKFSVKLIPVTIVQNGREITEPLLKVLNMFVSAHHVPCTVNRDLRLTGREHDVK
jgi:hypothetical protein